MTEAAKKILVPLMAFAMVGMGALAALGAEGEPTSSGTDSTDTTTATTSPPTDPGETVEVGVIKTSSISSERAVPETSVVYYFVYSGPGAADFQFDALHGCLVSFAGPDATPNRCAR